MKRLLNLVGIVFVLVFNFGCASWVAPQDVEIPSRLADGTIVTNKVPVSQLTPETVAALQTTASLLPPPWNTIASVALGAGATAFAAWSLQKRKTTTPTQPPTKS